MLAEARDGYQVLFSLGEVDPAFIDNEILLADTANGKALFGAQGRFRLVVPKDKPINDVAGQPFRLCQVP